MKSILTLAAVGLAFTALAQETPAGTTTTTAATPVTTSAAVPVNPGMPKIGYTNVQYLLSASPQTKVIKSQLESASKQYEKAITDKTSELEQKFAAYQKNEATMMDAIKQDKQDELRRLEASIRSLQETAQTELKTKENELVRPELDKIYAAINDVAKINGYSFVLNSDQVILYAAEGGDITSLVLKKLGYPEPKDDDETAKPPVNNATSKAAAAEKPSTPVKTGGAPSPSGKKKK